MNMELNYMWSGPPQLTLLVGEKCPATSLWVAPALLIELDDLRGSPMVAVNSGHPGSIHAVHHIHAPRVMRGILGDPSAGHLFVGIEMIRCLPLNAKSLPPKI
jgi:hypothetical protein